MSHKFENCSQRFLLTSDTSCAWLTMEGRACTSYNANRLMVLFNCKMPKLSGCDPLRTSKRLNPALPVMMMPGYPSVGIAVEAMQEGATDFITKPLRMDELRLAAYVSAATSGVHSKPASPLQELRPMTQ
jgi:FixJ family two-component response regulator